MTELAIDSKATASRSVSGTRGLSQYFYFAMSLLIVAVVSFGFSHTIDRNLIHPAVPRPILLYVHAAVFTAWLGFLILQSALVRTHNVRVHRAVGWFGMGLGGSMPILGVATAIVMGRFDTVQLHQTDAEATLIIPLFDMLAFGTAFGLAMYWRKRPEFHRRLILIACCALTAAGFGRFPQSILPPVLFYAGVDLLIMLGVARDLIVDGSVHRVYRYALPALVVGQVAVMYLVMHNVRAWAKIAHALLS